MIIKCPVCEGRGIVPNGFYTVPDGFPFASTSTAPETCRSCGGRGIIEEENKPCTWRSTYDY